MTHLSRKSRRGRWPGKKDREREMKVSPLKLFYIKVRQQEKTLRLWLVYHWQKQQASLFFPGQCRVQETKANHKPTRSSAFCLLMHARWSGETLTSRQTSPSKNIRTRNEVTNKARLSGFFLTLSHLCSDAQHTYCQVTPPPAWWRSSPPAAG